MTMESLFNEYCAYDDENPIDLVLVHRRVVTDPCIAVSEEFGYRDWIWFPPFPIAELEAKWQALPRCGNAFRKALGGDWYEMLDTNNRVIRLGRMNIRQHVCKDQRIFLRLQKPGTYHLHIFHDDESYLTRPDGVRLYHAGFSGKKTSPTENSEKHERWLGWWRKYHHQYCASFPLEPFKGKTRLRAKKRALRK